MMFRLRFDAPEALGVVLLASLMAGCGGDKDAPPAPPVILGGIAGRVVGAGLPVEASITAISVPAPEDSFLLETRVEAETDSLGRYAMDLPAGRYFLTVRTESGVSAPYFRGGVGPQRDGDTVVVGTEIVAADFIGGALTLRVETPPELEGFTISGRPEGSTNSAADDQEECTGGSAVLRFPWLLPQSYRLRLVNIPFASEFWFPGTRVRNDAVEIEIGPGGDETREMRVPRPARMRGSVRGSWQTFRTENPRVQACVPDPRHWSEYERLCSTTVEDHGEFSLSVLAPESVRVRVELGGSIWFGGSDFASATVFVLEPGEEISGLSLTESGLLCELTSSGMPASGPARIRVLDSEGRVATSASVDEGENLIPVSGLRPGTYFLSAEHEAGAAPWAAQWYDRKATFEEATPIMVTHEGEVVPVRLDVRRGGVIRGTVVQANGAPVSRRIVLWPAGMPGWSRAGETDPASGSYEVIGLEDGDYRIGSTIEEIFPVWYPGTTSVDSAAVVAIRDGTEVNGISWRLP